ncbi:hypothetical protein, partial [Pseudomonas aeruginosa]|uniref:hypothetical protein n=1 Tax=Pseudomonas aeruginosa TaxID=287 RepID=UPI00303A60E5
CFIGKLGGWGRGILPNQKVFFRVSLVEAMAGLQGVSPPFLRFPEALARMIAFVFSGIKMFPLTSSRIDSLVARTHYSCNKLNHILGYVPSRDITKEISEVILDKEGRR